MPTPAAAVAPSQSSKRKDARLPKDAKASKSAKAPKDAEARQRGKASKAIQSLKADKAAGTAKSDREAAKTPSTGKGAVLPSGAEPMSKVDTAWLRLDTEANRMVIHGILFLKPAIQLDAVRARVAERLLRFPRFRQRVVEHGDSAHWVEDQGVDIAHHVVAERLPRRRGLSRERALQDRLADLAAQPLAADRPLWMLHLIEDYDGGSALVARVHHCIADGIALIAVMLSITDGGIEPPMPKATKKGARVAAATVDAEPEWLADAMVKPINAWTVREIQRMRPIEGADDGEATGRAKGAKGANDARAANGATGGKRAKAGAEPADVSPADRLGKQVLKDAAALIEAPDDAKTRLKGKAGRAKRVAWGPALALDAVKAVGKSLNVSVNDVLLGCVAGAIGAYLRAHGDDTRGQEIRALVPVNLRPLESAWQLGNRFGMVPLPLPVGIANPVKRLYAVHAQTQALKQSLRPALALGLLAASGSVEKAAQRAMLKTLSRKATAMMTNVPGPTQPLGFCGATVDRVMFWAPQAGDMSLGVSILTYAGQVQFGLIADAGLCPDPERIVAHFEPQFQQLLDLALMLPWEAEA